MAAPLKEAYRRFWRLSAHVSVPRPLVSDCVDALGSRWRRGIASRDWDEPNISRKINECGVIFDVSQINTSITVNAT